MAAYEFTVSVRTQYLPEQSDPERTNYVFTYTITIKNTGTVAAQLISRHWVITDANNHVAGSARPGRGRPPALAAAGRAVRIHQRHPDGDAAGLDVRRIFLRGRRWPPFEAQIPEFVLSLPRTLH